jgi:NAD dependent epimerase/dehydratase family enzyme
MKILITGATGLIGKYLVRKLKEKGHEIVILTKKNGKPNEFQWNPDQNFIEDAAFKNVESIIHLAGATIAKRWTKEYKKNFTALELMLLIFLNLTAKSIKSN